MGGYGSAVADEMVKRADEIHTENKQKKDEEHARKISDLILQRQDLVNKIPTLQQGTPEYTEAHTALQGVNGDIADVYHPQKNPGAIEKFGHLLTDHLKLTNPDDRLKKETAQKQERTDAAAKTTDRQIAAAPLTAVQVNAQKIRGQLDEIDKSNLDEEGKKSARAKVFGVTTTVKPNFQQFVNPDGKTLAYYDVNKPDDIPDGASAVPKGSNTTAKETIAGFEEAVKNGYTGSYPQYVAEERRKGAPSTSALNEYAASYQKAYGIKPEEMTPADWDFISRKMAFDKAIPQTTTSNTLKQNAEQQWVPIQETNTKSPGGGAPLPPRGKPANNTPPPSQSSAAGASPSTTAPPTSPRALNDEAKKRNPRTSDDSTASPRSGGGANASVKVGDPLMAAPNKEYQDAKTAYDGAIHRKNLMHKNLADGLKGNQQAMLSLVANHIGMTLGAQKGARINQAVWNEAVESAPWLAKAAAKWGPEGYLSGVTLTPEQMKQMVELADESTEVTKDDLERIHKRINEGVTSQSKSPTSTDGGEAKKHKIKIGDKTYTYNGTGDTADIKNYTEVKK